MKRKFILKATKGNNDFGMTESNQFIYFFSPTLKHLRSTFRGLTAKGFRVPKEQTLSKWLKWNNGHLILQNPFFKTSMFEILEVENDFEIIKEWEYQNSFGFKTTLKLVDNKVGENAFKLTTV